MQIFSNPDRDISTQKPEPGSYEWWYFDAISDDNQYSLVVIFYEGNPFSRRYIDAIEQRKNDRASAYPAISISVYKESSPIFYSFEEVDPKLSDFSDITPGGHVKENSFKRVPSGEENLVYELQLNQILPNSDTLRGKLTFSSSGRGPFSAEPADDPGNNPAPHQWNLIQSSADVSGTFTVKGLQNESVSFKGKGYHDHNTGMEPMKESFQDWYWGRFHFGGGTLIYYMMNQESGRKDCAWLINSDNKVTQLKGAFRLSDMGLNVFGLKSARKIELDAGNSSFMIQQQSMLDDGPFYQRFASRLMLNLDGELHQANGISEYICPERIYMKLFRPLVNMRIKYPGKSHWVQKSPRLYRWTW